MNVILLFFHPKKRFFSHEIEEDVLEEPPIILFIPITQTAVGPFEKK